jgi:ElaB/YqjD/DUF883 family membrane-anchored ribosome-binding protein
MAKQKRDDTTVREDLEEMVDDARDALEDGLDEAYRYLKRQCRDNPLGVTATALGVGLVIGILLGSRR